MTTAALPRSAWRFFPLGIGASLALVVAVNAILIWSAATSFPGAVDDHAFDTGNSYNAIMDAAGRQAKLGWTLEAAVDPDGHVVVTFGGASPATPALTASAERPVGSAEKVSLGFALAAPGRFRSVEALPGMGQWDIRLTAAAQGAEFRTTRRLVHR